MPEIFDVSQWRPQPWFSTGGTRAKKFLQSPTDKFYYFKTSLQKTDRDYRFEFWSEIIAFEIGASLGFNVLKYDIAIDNNKIGCISESMIDIEKEKLVEGLAYLQGYAPSFNQNQRINRSQYSFQLIEDSLKAFKLEKCIENIIELIIFDALIGNGDRHQENWALITPNTVMVKTVDEIIKTISGNKSIFTGSIKGLIKSIFKHTPENVLAKMTTDFTNKSKSTFAPIYDNGSSLGRELDEFAINDLLSSQIKLNAYALRGKSEIHWRGAKVSHFDLINFLKEQHLIEISNCIKRIRKKFDIRLIENILARVDALVPNEFSQFKLSSSRKEFIVKNINARFAILSNII